MPESLETLSWSLPGLPDTLPLPLLLNNLSLPPICWSTSRAEPGMAVYLELPTTNLPWGPIFHSSTPEHQAPTHFLHSLPTRHGHGSSSVWILGAHVSGLGKVQKPPILVAQVLGARQKLRLTWDQVRSGTSLISRRLALNWHLVAAGRVTWPRRAAGLRQPRLLSQLINNLFQPIYGEYRIFSNSLGTQ